MATTVGKMIRTAALTTVWSISALGIAHKASGQVFVPGSGELKILKEIVADCTLDDDALAENLAEQLNAFLKAEHEKGTPDIEKGPFGVDVFPPALLDAFRKKGIVDMSVTTRPDIEQGPRFFCTKDLY